MALQPPGVGLGPLYNTPPSLSIPCSVPPFVYSHLSPVRGHVIHLIFGLPLRLVAYSFPYNIFFRNWYDIFNCNWVELPCLAFFLYDQAILFFIFAVYSSQMTVLPTFIIDWKDTFELRSVSGNKLQFFSSIQVHGPPEIYQWVCASQGKNGWQKNSTLSGIGEHWTEQCVHVFATSQLEGHSCKVAKGHTGYCGLVRGPHVDKHQ